MARPRKEGLSYFPHDCDASGDEKIEALRSLFGNDGYAFYFIMLERIYRAPNCELSISGVETRQILSRKVGVSLERFDAMVNASLKFGCFDARLYAKKKILSSRGIKKRGEVVQQKREKMRQVYRKRVSDAETPPEAEQKSVRNSTSKEKGSRVQDSEVRGHSRASTGALSPSASGEGASTASELPPRSGRPENGERPSNGKARPDSVEEVAAYFAKIGIQNSQIEADKFWDHFSANGWRIGGKTPMRDWMAACRNWKRRKETYDGNSAFRGTGNGNGSARTGSPSGQREIITPGTIESITSKARAILGHD